MKVERSDRDGVVVLALEGEFDSFETDAVASAFQSCIDEGANRIALDCEKLLFVNSTTIAFLIRAQKTSQGHGGEIVIARPRDFIHKTLETLGLGQIFRMTGTLDEAIALLASP